MDVIGLLAESLRQEDRDSGLPKDREPGFTVGACSKCAWEACPGEVSRRYGWGSGCCFAPLVGAGDADEALADVEDLPAGQLRLDPQ
jgi:hypothetical protein